MSAGVDLSSVAKKKCAKCPATLVWARAARTQRPMPVDVAPASNGNVRLRLDSAGLLVADVLGTEQAARARDAGEALHLNHFATCPFSRDFGKRKGAQSG